MIHPILLAVIQEHLFLFYFVMGLLLACAAAYWEGRAGEKEEVSGFVFFLWPFFVIGVTIWGIYTMVQMAHKAGSEKK